MQPADMPRSSTRRRWTYWGVSAKLQDALEVSSKTDVKGALTPSFDELPRLQTRHAAAVPFLLSVEDPNDVEACVQVLEPENVRVEFDLAFNRCSQSSACPRLLR